MKELIEKLKSIDKLNEFLDEPPNRGGGEGGGSGNPAIFFAIWMISLYEGVRGGAYGLPPLSDVKALSGEFEELRKTLNRPRTINQNQNTVEMNYTNTKTDRAKAAHAKWVKMNAESNDWWNPYPHFNIELIGSNFGYVNGNRAFNLRVSLTCSPLKKIEIDNGEVVDKSFFDKSFEIQVIEGKVSEGGNEYQIMRKTIEYMHQCYEHCL